MNKLGKILSIAFGLGVIATVLMLVPNHQAKAAGPPVGQNIGAFNASLPVTVVNPSLPVTLSNNPDLSPFSASCTVHNPNTNNNNELSCAISVPATKEFIIESVEAESVNDFHVPGVEFVLNFTTGGAATEFAEAIPDDKFDQPTGGHDVATTSTVLRADPGTTITCGWSTGPSFQYNTTVVGITDTCNLSGYTVSIP